MKKLATFLVSSADSIFFLPTNRQLFEKIREKLVSLEWRTFWSHKNNKKTVSSSGNHCNKSYFPTRSAFIIMLHRFVVSAFVLLTVVEAIPKRHRGVRESNGSGKGSNTATTTTRTGSKGSGKGSSAGAADYTELAALLFTTDCVAGPVGAFWDNTCTTALEGNAVYLYNTVAPGMAAYCCKSTELDLEAISTTCPTCATSTAVTGISVLIDAVDYCCATIV